MRITLKPKRNRRLTDDEQYLSRIERMEHALAFCIDAVEEHLNEPNADYLRRAVAMARAALKGGFQAR